MNEVLVMALVNRFLAGGMTLEQVPVPYLEAVQARAEEVQSGQE